MTTAIRRRRGTTAQHSTFIGLEGETTIDTDKEVVVVHDGTTQGGFPLMRENGSNSALALGSAGTPSLKFTGDTNTGIYSPGADQVAISTNGTGRLFVDASGNVGVGAAPVVPLDIQQAQATQRLYSTTGTNTSHIQFRNTGGIAYVGLDSSTGGSFGAAYGLSLAHTGAYPITFVTNGLERMRLDSSGRLGLGTTLAGNANNRLLVRSDSASAISNVLLLNNGPADNNAGQGVRINLSGVSEANSNIRYAYIEAANQTSSNDHYLAFGTNSAAATPTERLRITSAGNVGIGTSSPERPLHVIGTGRFDNGAIDSVYTGTTTGDQLGIFRTYGVGAGVTGEVDLIGRLESGSLSNSYFSINTTFSGVIGERLRVDSSGRVGIGTTSPSTTLDVEGNIAFGDTSTGAAIISTVKGGNSIYFGVDNSTGSVFGTGTAYSPVIYTGAAAPITFSNSGTERARIDSSGRLLVGTSTALTNLYDQATSYTPNVQFSSASQSYNAGLSLINYSGLGYPATLTLGQSGSNTLNTNALVGNGNCVGSINFVVNDGSNFRSGATVQAFVDAASGSGDVPARLVFSTTADGAASPTERMRITNTGAVLINTTTTATNALFEVSSNGTKKSFQVYNNDNVQLYSLGTGTVYSNGGVLTNTNPSDERLKDSIETLGWGLEEVMALRPVSFDWKNNRTNQGRQYGFIAQEVQSVMPELVTEFETVDGDETVTRLGLEKDGIYAALVKAIQEQQTMIADLQAKVAALEAS